MFKREMSTTERAEAEVEADLHLHLIEVEVEVGTKEMIDIDIVVTTKEAIDKGTTTRESTEIEIDVGQDRGRHLMIVEGTKIVATKVTIVTGEIVIDTVTTVEKAFT